MNYNFPSVQRKIKTYIKTNEQNKTTVDAVDICCYIGLRADIVLTNLHALVNNGDIRHERHGLSSKYVTNL